MLGTQFKPVPDGQGGAFVAWSVAYGQVFIQRLHADGHPLWTPNGIPVSSSTLQQGGPRLAQDGNGGVYIVFAEYPGANVFVQRLTAFGFVAPGWPPNGIPLASAPGSVNTRFAVSDGQGGLYVPWTQTSPTSGYDPYLQRVTGAGSIAPGWPPGDVHP